MALTISRKSDNRVVKSILHRIADIPGGVGVSVADLGGSALFEGTPLCKGSNGLFKVVKTAQVVTAYTTGTSLEVGKGHHFKAGDVISKAGSRSIATITAIDKSNAAKDTLTLAASFGEALAVNDCLVLVTVSTEKHEAIAQGAATTTDTSFKVDKGHKFAVGDIIAGKAASKFVGETITAIDRGNDTYDIITVATTISVAIVDGDVLIAVKAVGDVGATTTKQQTFDVITPQGAAVAIAGDNKDVEANTNLFVPAWVIGVVRETNAPIVNDVIKAQLTGIIYV